MSTMWLQRQLDLSLLAIATGWIFGIAVVAEIDIVKPPTNARALLGEIAVFTCEAMAGNRIDFTINGILQANYVEASQLGFNESDTAVTTNDDESIIIKRSLFVATNSQNNNSFIHCRVFDDINQNIKTSKTAAYLFVDKVSILEPSANRILITSTRVGKNSTFTCVARAKMINFFIFNGTINADYQSSYAKGLVKSSAVFTHSNSPRENIIQRNITVISTVENNNTFITCRAINSIFSKETSVEYRIVAFLTAQGSVTAFSLKEPYYTPMNIIPSNIKSENEDRKAKIIVPPTPVNVVLGKTGEFVCKAADADDIVFLVNKTISTYENISSMGFETKPIAPGLNGTITGTLLAQYAVNGSTSNNHSEIVCTAYNIINNTIMNLEVSRKVLFQVQGALAPVLHLYVEWINSSSVIVSWDPPFILPGTNITGYNVSFQDIYSQETIIDTFTTENFYLLRQNASCYSKVTVRGYNELNGKTSSSLIADSPIVNVGKIISTPQELVILSLTVDIPSENICWNSFIAFINVNVSFNDGRHFRTFNEVPLSNLTTNTLTTDNVIELYTNEKYNVVVTYVDLQMGNKVYPFSSNLTNFRPDPPLTVIAPTHPSHDNASIGFKCKFSSSAAASGLNAIKGCLIQLISKSDASNFSGNSTIMSDNKVVVLIDEIDDGKYVLEGYIIEVNGSTVLAFIDTHYEVSSANTKDDHLADVIIWVVIGVVSFGVIVIIAVVIIALIVQSRKINQLQSQIELKQVRRPTEPE